MYESKPSQLVCNRVAPIVESIDALNGTLWSEYDSVITFDTDGGSPLLLLEQSLQVSLTNISMVNNTADGEKSRAGGGLYIMGEYYPLLKK